MKKDFSRCEKECDVGSDLCNRFTFDLLKAEARKNSIEFQTMKLKAQAKKNNTSALDMKELEEKAREAEKSKISANEFEAKAMTQKNTLNMNMAMLTFFGVTAGAFGFMLL